MEVPDGATGLWVTDLTVGYGGLAVVKKRSLHVERGSVICVIGPNGAGKSTLAKGVAGLLQPMGGRLYLDGLEISRRSPESRARMGMGDVPQVKNIFPSLTVRENLVIGCYLSTSTMARRIEEMYTMFPDLRGAARRDSWMLSGGQRSMLGIARALMPEPTVLVADEPSAGLAPQVQHGVWKHIRAVAELGIGVLVIDQNVRLALANSDWASLMVLGRVQISGPARSLLDDPELVSLYIGGASSLGRAAEAADA